MRVKSNSIIILATCFTLFASCTTDTREKNPILQALASTDEKIKKVADSIQQYQVQILFTQINRNTKNIPSFTDYRFQVNDSNYFYPASTVKFPIAVLALEKLASQDTLHTNTQFYIEGDSIETTFEKEVNKIFAVSDNDAYNRLFEYMGTDYINENLHKKGVQPVRISHRLSAPDADNVKTKPLVLYLNDTTVTHTDPTFNKSPKRLQLENLTKGRGFFNGDSVVLEPFDFSLKNYLPITTLHNLMKRVIFPDKFKAEETFQLGQKSRKLLLKAMHTLPAEYGYNPETYYDSYGKFFIYGDTKDSIPSYIKIYNKVGYAYGTLTDCAYVHDTKNNIEFLLTATILVNKNGIFNDNIYEYETIGIPFLATLGREIYQQELNRK